ncbi:ribosome assembly RNA-binding protein YhbY [Thorsellia anophelis]|uniref:RNA-binding protein n=1 Tax=Thorsellia anophelis DSM 18579 TaxID=1123402 RepID=A0A1I0CV77_9GAMM|nr:ribosome assembly RNA-binding protein YhbY [Thorsellia anophelis]SET23468.1 RNA-binding protein [Thorsellia anophelis DSM 18579]
MTLNNKQKQHLKGLAHTLKPVVMIGNNGLTEGVLAEIDASLDFHELIKVRISAEDRDTKKLIVNAIVAESKAIMVQLVGNILTLYRASLDKKINLPK